MGGRAIGGFFVVVTRFCYGTG